MQTDNQYAIYENECLNLAETLIFKSDYSARILNKHISLTNPYSFDESDRRTWKYYMNLAGDYYPTDRQMQIQSVDTQEIIVFNKTNLAVHRATAREYQYGTKLYKELVALYPNQEELIIGILYPVDYDVSINAQELDIIGYPSHLVESNEASLIEKIEQFVKRFYNRWHNKVYRTVEERYEESFLGMIFLFLPALILKLRQDACKTNEAHSYHIKQYLASHLGLDRYFDVMTLEQRLWFYRNIRWVDRNAGRTETFNILTEKIMSLRKLALASYQMTHNTKDILTDLEPSVQFKRIPKNDYVSDSYQQQITLEDLLNKELRLAISNPEEIDEKRIDIDFELSHSLSNVVQTKVLESAMYDYSDATPFPFSDVLMQHWPYLASKGIYRSYVRVINPRTGDIIPLSVKDAYVFAQYLLLGSQGIVLDKIQPVICRKVQVVPKPTASDLLKMTSGKYFDLAFASDLLKYNPTLTNIISTDAYWETCREIFTALKYQRGITSLQEHFVKRGEVHGMCARVYGVYYTFLEPEDTLYTDWFVEKNLLLEDFPVESYEEVYRSIVEQALGLDINTTDSLKNIQSQMVSMFSDLSSYSVQFIKEINDSAIRIMDWPVIRLGDSTTSVRSQAYFIDVAIDIFNLRAKSSQVFDYNVNSHFRINDPQAQVKHSLVLPIPRQFLKDPIKLIINFKLPSNSPWIMMEQPRNNLYPDGQYPVPGIDTTYLNLTQEQRRSLPDVYETDWWNNQQEPMTE